jgi:hypothetical protein
MDKSEQRVLIKYFSMKDLNSRTIHNELKSVLLEATYSLSTVERWVSRFKTGAATCEDNQRPCRPPCDFGSSLAAFLLEFAFASACQMSKHLHTSHTTIKDILRRQLGLRRFSRRWVPHQLSEDQKTALVRDSIARLAIVRPLQDNSFERLSPGDESWFLYEYLSGSMFAASRETIRSRCEHKIQGKKTMITVFFTTTLLLILNALPHSQTFTQ